MGASGIKESVKRRFFYHILTKKEKSLQSLDEWNLVNTHMKSARVYENCQCVDTQAQKYRCAQMKTNRAKRKMPQSPGELRGLRPELEEFFKSAATGDDLCEPGGLSYRRLVSKHQRSPKACALTTLYTMYINVILHTDQVTYFIIDYHIVIF